MTRNGKAKLIDDMTDEELSEMLYSNPRALINQVRNEERTAAATERSQSEFWSRFYGHYPQFKEDRAIVEGVLQRDFERLRNTPVDAAMEQIAELVQQEIEATQRRWHGQKEYNIIRGGPGIPADQANVAPPAGESVTGLLKRRRQNRRDAAQGFVGRRVDAQS